MPRVLLLLPTTTYRAPAFMEAALRFGVEFMIRPSADWGPSVDARRIEENGLSAIRVE